MKELTTVVPVDHYDLLGRKGQLDPGSKYLILPKIMFRLFIILVSR